MNLEFINASIFFRSYFHQDWDIDGASDKAVVEYFTTNETTESIRLVRDDLKLLVEGYKDKDDGLAQKLSKLGNEYYYQADNLSATQWVKKIIAFLG